MGGVEGSLMAVPGVEPGGRAGVEPVQIMSGEDGGLSSRLMGVLGVEGMVGGLLVG